MNISDIHNYILFIERKERLSLHTHAEIDMALDAAQLEILDDYFSKFGFNQPIIDAFALIKSTAQFSTRDGIVALPNDYIHLTGLQTVSYDNKRKMPVKTLVRIVKDDELSNAFNSQLRPISERRPIAIFSDNTITLYPSTPQAGNITYIRRPRPPHYAYTQNGRSITFDSVNSIDLEFKDNIANRIVNKALLILGVNLDDATIMQASQIKDKENANN